jgi:hypothetical protein
LVLGVVAVLALAGWGIVKILSGPQGAQDNLEAMIEYGKERVRSLRAEGIDLSSGPCIDNGEKFPGWVIDVAHSPREPVDNLPENQCSAYREGRAEHFIELSPDANFIRSQ